MEIAHGVNTATEEHFAAKQGTLRGCSHYPPELELWLSPGVFDLVMSQPVRVWSCLGVEALPPSPCMWPAGFATRIASGHRGPTRMPPLGLAIVPCDPGIECCDTPERLRPVRTLLAVRRRTMSMSALFPKASLVMSRLRLALICWLCAAFSHPGLLMYSRAIVYVFTFPFWVGPRCYSLFRCI